MGEASDRLTAREKEVLELMASLGSAKLVARQLGLSPRTIEAHLANARQKLEVETTVQAVAAFQGHSFVAEPSQPGASNRRPFKWRLAALFSAILLVSGVLWVQRRAPVMEPVGEMLAELDSVDHSYTAIRKVAIEEGGSVRFFTNWSSVEDGGIPVKFGIGLQDESQSSVEVVTDPDQSSNGKVIRFLDLSQETGPVLRRRLEFDCRLLFLDWEQYLTSKDDVLLVEIAGWVIVASYPDPEVFEKGWGFVVSGGNDDEPPGTVKLKVGEWQKVAVIIDAGFRRSYVWIDDTLIASEVLPRDVLRHIERYSFTTGGYGMAPNGSLIRNINETRFR